MEVCISQAVQIVPYSSIDDLLSGLCLFIMCVNVLILKSLREYT